MAIIAQGGLTSYLKKVSDRWEKVAHDTINTLCYRIVHDTPVGDPVLWSQPPPANYQAGTLKFNWQASVDQPKTDFLSGTQEDTATKMADITPIIGAAIGSVFYMTNNTPYARRIEFTGWSTQAPAGMLRVNLAKYEIIAKQSDEENSL